MSKPRKLLVYEYDFCPDVGEAIDILPGLKWLRLPLPFMLGHINVWLLKDEDGWAIVDTGIFSSKTRNAWENIFSGCMNNAPVSQVFVTHLHPEHACLYNPLAGWFESLHRFKNELPDDVLVLPAHGKPFRGVKGRLNELIEEHEVGLDKLRDFCHKSKRAVDVFPALFKSRITDSNLLMATGEAIAHLNYLLYAGEASINTDEDGTRWYQSRD